MATACTYCGGNAVAPGMNEDDYGACCHHCDGTGMEPSAPEVPPSAAELLKAASAQYLAGELTTGEYQYACEVALYRMSEKQHELREKAITELITFGVAEDRAYAIDILAKRGWFPEDTSEAKEPQV